MCDTSRFSNFDSRPAILWRPSLLSVGACLWSEFWVRCLPSEAQYLARPGLSRGCPASSQSALLQSSPGLRDTSITPSLGGFWPGSFLGTRPLHIGEPDCWANIVMKPTPGPFCLVLVTSLWSQHRAKWRHADAVITSVSGLSKQKIGSEWGHCHCHAHASNTDANNLLFGVVLSLWESHLKIWFSPSVLV